MILLGLFAGVLNSISFIPQSIKTIKTKDIESISLITYILYVMGVALWIIYGFLTKDIAVFLTNVVTIVPCTIILSIEVLSNSKFRKKQYDYFQNYKCCSNNFSTCKIVFVFGYVLIAIKQYHVAIVSVFSNQKVLVLLRLLVNYLLNFH